METGKSDPCLEIKGLNAKESCLHNLAKQELDLKVCELIETEEWRDKCVDKVYELCESKKITDPENLSYYCEGATPPSHEKGATGN